MSSELPDELSIRAEGLGKVYANARVGSMESSLREVVTTCLTAPWRLLPGLGRKGGNEDVVALEPISFSVRCGEKLGIIGRNGSGKSTLLKILSQITPPSSGRLAIRGRVAAILEVGTGFHPELTGHENIYLNGAILGLRREEVEAALPGIIAFSEIGDFLNLPVKRYSSGMYVRLAFSVAAHLACDVLLIDEVLAVGDSAFREKCIAKMESEAAEGRTVVLVSHHMEDIRRFCSRVIHLHGGEIEFDGGVEEGIARYEAHCGEGRHRGHV
jgi:lipopolysaccharide transport system ATP-binding protein